MFSICSPEGQVDVFMVHDGDCLSELNKLLSASSLLISISLEPIAFLLCGSQVLLGGSGFLLSFLELNLGSPLSVKEFLESGPVDIGSLAEISVDEGTKSLLHLLSLRLVGLDVLLSLCNEVVGCISEGFVIKIIKLLDHVNLVFDHRVLCVYYNINFIQS